MPLEQGMENIGGSSLMTRDALKAKISPKKGGDKIVEMAERRWGPVAGLGVSWFIDYIGLGKKEEEKVEKKSNKESAEGMLSKLKVKVSNQKNKKKGESVKIEPKKSKKLEIDNKLTIKAEKMTISEDIKMARQIESMNSNERVMFAMMLAREKFKTGGMHCWDWMDKIYTSVGCGRRVIYRNVKNYRGQDCRVAPHAIIKNGKVGLPNGQFINLKPGDHISINNRNKADRSDKRGGGNHSVAFLGWVKEGIAKVVGYDAKSNASTAYNVNLNNQPIVHISRPVIKKAVNLSILEFHLRQKPAKIKGKFLEKIV